MSMPASWVESLFSRLAIRYGAVFIRQYASMDADAVKADWAQVLDGFSREAVKHAIDNLPHEKPPNAMQFRAICSQWSEPKRQALSAPTSAPTAEVLQRASQILTTHRPQDPKAWARRLREREIVSKGVGMTRAQREMWRTALGYRFNAPADSAPDAMDAFANNNREPA